jgi:hypothetical protein
MENIAKVIERLQVLFPKTNHLKEPNRTLVHFLPPNRCNKHQNKNIQKTGNKNDKNMSFGISQPDEGKYFVRKK